MRRPEGEPSDIEPRVLMFRDGTVPTVSEIKGQHVEDEHGVMLTRASPKRFEQRGLEIVFALSGFHRRIGRASRRLIELRPATTKQLWDSLVRLKR